jgi:hypothetical protein
MSNKGATSAFVLYDAHDYETGAILQRVVTIMNEVEWVLRSTQQVTPLQHIFAAR